MPSLYFALLSLFSPISVCCQEDERVRNNRLALLTQIASLPRGIADLSKLPGF